MLRTKVSLAVLALGLMTFSDGQAFASEKIFKAQKCDKCHSVTSAGIEAKAGSDEEGEEAGAKTPDLSSTGKAHDAAFFKAYLNKEVALADGKKHKVKFKGTPEELDELSAWLATLKK